MQLWLDDGTITHLDSKNVTGQHRIKMSIQNGFLTAKQVSKCRVSIEATAEGFKAILFVRILKDQSHPQDAEDGRYCNHLTYRS